MGRVATSGGRGPHGRVARGRSGSRAVGILGALFLAAAGCGDAAGPPPEPPFPVTPEHVIVYSGVKPENPDDANLFVIRADGTGEIRLTREEGGRPAWSPDGSRLAFERLVDGEFALFTMNADGTGVARITELEPADPPEGPPSAFHPAWSPDGSRVVFASPRTGEGDLYVVAAEGGPATRLLASPEPEGNPDWSPDGERVLFQRHVAGGTEIWVVGADGTEPRRLSTSEGHDEMPRWSPDGSRIVFSRYLFAEGQADLWVMAADGSGQTRLTADPASDVEPAWSPDGGRIVFVRSAPGTQRLRVVDADGTDPAPLTDLPGDFTMPDWR